MTVIESSVLLHGTSVRFLDGAIGRLVYLYADNGGWGIEVEPGNICVLPPERMTRRTDGEVLEVAL